MEGTKLGSPEGTVVGMELGPVVGTTLMIHSRDKLKLLGKH